MVLRKELRLAYRNYFYAFLRKAFETLHPGEELQDHWYLESICVALEEVIGGADKRLLLTMPPRHLKSVTVSVAFVAWLLGRFPHMKIMVASYGEDLAKKHGEDCRKIMASDWYKEVFPRTKLIKLVATDLVTSEGGGRRAVSVHGALTGFGADIILVDDIMKAQDAYSPTIQQEIQDFYRSALYSRLNDKESGAIVVVQQRLAENDLPGYLLSQGGFRHLNLPAKAMRDQTFPLYRGRVHVRREGELLLESQAALDQTRRAIGDIAFSAQYQQEPVAPGGNRFRWEWFETYEAVPGRDELLLLVQSWDTASETEPNSSYSVCTTWGLRQDDRWLLLDIDRHRFHYPDLKSRALYLAGEWRPDYILMEHASTGLALLRELRREVQHGTVISVRAIQDKATRLDVETAKISEGRALRPTQAPWLEEFRLELTAFPGSRFDDQVDSMTQFLRWMGTRQGHAISEGARAAPRTVRRKAKRRSVVRR